MSRHVAVVPISTVDVHTAGALRYAESLASEVIALHLRVPGRELESEWSAGVPLVIVDAPPGGEATALRNALSVLGRTAQADRISVVIPWQHGLDDLTGPSGLTIHHAPPAD